MSSKYIPAVKLIAEIKRLSATEYDGNTLGDDVANGALDYVLEEIIPSLQQEPIKVYRVENEKEQKGLWRKFDGTWEPLFDMLTDGQCKDMPMEDSPIYREGGKQWFASAPSKETLQKWFSKRDLEELTAKGFTISEFEVLEYKKLSDFEFIFTRDSIISRTYLKVSDIYPQEQPKSRLIQVKCIHPYDESWEKDKVYVCEVWHHGDLNIDFWDVYYDYGNNPKYVQFPSIQMLNEEFAIVEQE